MKTATLQHYAASPRFTPREIVRLASAPEGLDLCFGFLRQVPFQQVRLAAAFRAGRPEAVPQLLLILGGQDRPFIVKASGIAFQEFDLPAAENDEEALRGFLTFLARHHPGLTVPDDTARFAFEGGLEETHRSAIPSLATSLRVVVDPELGEGIPRLAIAPKEEVVAKKVPTPQGSEEGSGKAVADPVRSTVEDEDELPWQRRLIVGLDSSAPAPPLLPPFGPALRYGPRRRGELLKGFRESIPEVELSRSERLLLPIFGMGMLLVPLLYLASIFGLSYAIYHFASTDGQALVEGSVSESWEPGSFSFLLAISVCIYLIFALLSPLFTRQPRERHRLTLQRGQELVLFGFVDYLAKVMDAPVPQRIDVMQEPDISVSYRQKDNQTKELIMILGLPLVAGLSLGELVGFLSRELSVYAYRPGGDLQLFIARQHRRGERILADYAAYQDSLGSRFDERMQGGQVGFLTVIVSFLAFVFFSSTRWVVMFFVKLSEWISLLPRRWAVRDAERFQRQMVGSGLTESGLAKQSALRESYRQLVLSLDDLSKSRDEDDEAPAVLDHLPVQLALSSLDADNSPQRSRVGNPRGKQVIFESSLPSTVLFQDFADLARKATTDFYRSQGVRGVSLEPVDSYIDVLRDEAMPRQALHRFFGGTVNSRRPVPVAPQLVPEDRSMSDLMSIVASQRQKFESSLGAYREAVEDFDIIVDCRLGAREAFKLVELDFEHQGMSVEEWKTMEHDAVLRLQDLSVTLEAFERQAGQRLMSTLLLLADRQRASQLPNGERWFQRVPLLLKVVAEINGSFRSLLELRDRHAVLSTLREIETRSPEDKRLLLELFEREADTLYPPIMALYKGLGSALNLFHISGCDVGLMAHGVANDYFDLAGDVLRRIYDVYFRALAELATIAEQVELASGFEPLENRGPFPEARPWRT